MYATAKRTGTMIKEEKRRKKEDGQEMKAKRGQMRFIGNLHAAMRITNDEKQMIRELNALH